MCTINGQLRPVPSATAQWSPRLPPLRRPTRPAPGCIPARFGGSVTPLVTADDLVTVGDVVAKIEAMNCLEIATTCSYG
jgi:pyruvate carboxylase